MPVLVLLAVGSATLTGSPRAASAQTPPPSGPETPAAQARIESVARDEHGAVTATVVTPPGVTLDGVEALVDGAAEPATFSLVPSTTGQGSLVIAIEASSNTTPSLLQQSKGSAYTLLDALPAQVSVAIVAYGDDATMISGFTTDRTATRNTIAGIVAKGASALYDAVAISGSALADAPTPRIMAMFGWGWDFGGGSTTSRAVSLQHLAASGATAHVFALGGEHDVNYAGQLAGTTGGTYNVALSPAALALISSAYAPESLTYSVYLDAPVVLASGGHELTLRLSVGGVAQEVRAEFETESPSVIALGTPSRSADNSRIEVPVEALVPLDALGSYSLAATADGSALPLGGPAGPVVIDAWQFAAGMLPVEVTVFVDDHAVSRATREVNVPSLGPELNVLRGEAGGDASGEELSINWRAQGGGAALLVTAGGEEVIRTANRSVLLPVATNAPVVVRILAQDGTVLAERTSGEVAVPAPTSTVDAEGDNFAPVVLAVFALLALLGGAGWFGFRYRVHRRWQNARGAGAITGEHLYTALSNGEMTLHYQPILDAAGERLAGVEALVRWEHPEYGTVSPRRFLAKAESTGVMRYLGEFVLRTACDFTHELHESRLPGVRLTVNVSASQLEDPGFSEIVSRALRESGLEAESLEIEVNERASLARPAVIEGLAQVRALGVEIGLDDYWSEALTSEQLKSLGVSSVKVDLWSNTGSPGARLRIHEAVERARGLGLTVTAKRVETLHEVEFLRELNCDYAQGHAFNEPMPEDVFLARMGLFEEEERLAS